MEEKEVIFSEYQSLGINRNVSPFLRLPGQWRRVVNAHIAEVGVLEKRKGYSVAVSAPTAHEVLSYIPFNIGSTNKLIMITAEGTLYSSDLSTSSWGAAKVSGLNTSARWTGTVMSDSTGIKYMILGNGFQVLKTTDAVTFTTVAGAPLGKYWTQLYQKVYAAGVPADPDVLHESATGDLTNWSTVSPNDSASRNIDKNNKGNIKGIIMANDRVVICKERAIKRWDGEYLLTPPASDVLCAPYSLAELLGVVFMLGRDNLYLYNGSIPKTISLPILDIIRNIDRGSSNIEKICGVGSKNKYYLSIGNVTDDDGYQYTNCWIVYDMLNDSFFLYSLGVRATAICEFVKDDGSKDIYFGDASGVTYKMFDTDQDNGEDVEMLVQGHKIYPGGASSSKEPKFMTLIADPADGFIATIIADNDNKENVSVAEKNVTNAYIGKLGDDNSAFELHLSHVGKGRPRFYGYDIRAAVSEDRI